jgi:hypothetical protein
MDERTIRPQAESLVQGLMQKVGVKVNNEKGGPNEN